MHSSVFLFLITANNFSDVGHENVDSLGVPGVIFTLLHVERLDLVREAVQHDRLVDGVRHKPLRSLRDILPELVEGTILLLVVVILQPLDGLRVFHPPERLLGRDELGIELVNHVAQRRLEDSVHHVAHQVLQPVQQLREVDEGTLGLDMGVLSNVSPGARLLRPK